EMPLLDLSLATTAVRVSGTQAQLHLEHRDDRTAGNLQAAITQVVLPGQNAQFNSLELTIPFAQPTPEGADNAAAGSITIGSLGRQDTPLASFAATINQFRDQFNLAGTLRAVFPPHPEIRMSGSVMPAARQFSASWQLPPTIIDSKLLPAVSGIPAPLGFTGTLSARGNLQRSEDRLSGSLTVDLLNGSFSHEAQHLNVSAIDCSLKFPRLPDIISAPSQRCTAGRIDIGALRFEDAEITYRLEDSRTVFVEKSRVNWCRGTLESGSIRLSADNPDIDTILYSSRINFADLLNQFGFDQTEGEGALNGKLPVSWSGKRLLIDDGFLFSTPGAGGIVRFTNTDLLRQGIGAVQQAGSLGYSLKALEDFAYNWSRLSFNSSGDELLMTMELDGRPRSPLPYAFKDGILVEAEQGNLQYPIRLDINLRLPLAELLQVGHNVKSMMGN
ncbi:MAG: YdbH domain-containing protein, partial [Desulfofustis sp.]|nr:YdbH domain-containing protein [Desulfofustis sp.]